MAGRSDMRTFTLEEVLEIIGKDEEQYLSGYQRNNTLTRNKLRAEQREKLNETNKEKVVYNIP